MRDIAILLILFGLAFAAFFRPWLGVLGLAIIGYMNPHKYASDIIASLPAYKILFIVTSISVIRTFIINRDEIKFPTLDWKLVLLLSLWGYFLLTTFNSIAPAYAWPKFYEVTKIFISLLFTLLLINSRKKLFYLIITIATCFGLLVLKGGYWAIMTGFSDRVYGPPGSHFYDNNHFAIAVIMTIPLFILWLRETQNNRLRYILMILVFLCTASALSSWSRGALLSLCVTTILIAWHSKRKYFVIPVIFIGIFLSFEYLPNDWFERMGTIQTFEQDRSARSRLETWKIGADYAFKHPLTGAGFEGWRYINYNHVGIDWHNAYIEIMAEHGLIAFLIWLTLLLGSIIELSVIAKRGTHKSEYAWVRNYAVMIQITLVAYATGAIFLGISYWDLLYHFIIITTLLKQLTREPLIHSGLN